MTNPTNTTGAQPLSDALRAFVDIKLLGYSAPGTRDMDMAQWNEAHRAATVCIEALSSREQAGAVAYQVHEEDALRIHATLYAPVLKEFCLEATRDDDGRNWYIKVTDEGGYHTYDGYWRDSHGKSPAEVLAEAVSGSMLDEISAPPQDAIPLAAPGAAVTAREQFQQRVRPWLLTCFGEQIAGDREERNHRFLEEALELVQACGCTAIEAHQLVDYTFGRPVGEKAQEVGGVMVTLAALCLAQDLDMHGAGETELARISVPEVVARIRAKQAAKPKHSPLPAASATCRLDDGRCGICGGDWSMCGCEGMLRRSAVAPEPDNTPLETGEADAR